MNPDEPDPRSFLSMRNRYPHVAPAFSQANAKIISPR